LVEGGPSAAYLGEHLVGGCGPDKRLGVLVVSREVSIDRVDQVGYRSEHAATDGFVGELAEEDLDEVQPRARGRGEVQVKARVLGQPGLDLLALWVA
jgi:hypothetical protein